MSDNQYYEQLAGDGAAAEAENMQAEYEQWQAEMQMIEEQVSKLSMFETSRDQRKQFVDNVIVAIQNGVVDPRLIHVQLKNTEDLLKQITDNKEYKKLLVAECEKFGKSHEFHNAKIEVKEVGTKWDYSVCEDETYNELERQINDLNEKKKSREKFLQIIPEGGTVDPHTGNMIYRAIKTSTTSVAVTLK